MLIIKNKNKLWGVFFLLIWLWILLVNLYIKIALEEFIKPMQISLIVYTIHNTLLSSVQCHHHSMNLKSLWEIFCKQTVDKWLIGIVNSFHQTISILQNVKIVLNLKNNILSKKSYLVLETIHHRKEQYLG